VCLCDIGESITGHVLFAAGRDLTYSNWYRAAADNAQWEPMSRNNPCMIMDPGRGYTWSDSDCTIPYPYVCQQSNYKKKTIYKRNW
jgi:hypothetical protein